MLKPKKILLFRIDRIGDMFCSTPAIRAFRQAYPDARIDLVASNKNYSVVLNNPDVDNVYVFPLNKFWLWPYFYLKFRFLRYDMAVALNGISKTASRMVAFSKAKIKAGTYSKRTKKYYDLTVQAQPNEHVITHMLQLAAELGASTDDTSMVFPLEANLVSTLSKRFPVRENQHRIAIFIGNAKKVDTRWAAEKFVELTERLVNRNNTEVYIVAGPGDEQLLGGFHWTERCKLYPGGSLQELGAFLQTCDLFITSSTGPMHLAAAVRAPMITILGQYCYDCWRPLDNIHRSVQSNRPGVSVENISVDAVYKEAVEALDALDLPN